MSAWSSILFNPLKRRARRLAGALADATSMRRWQQTRVDAWTGVCGALILVGFAVVFVRVAQLQIAPNPRIAEAVDQKQSSRVHQARRGDLLDRRGRLIATTVDAYRVFIDPKTARRDGDPDQLPFDLADILDVEPVTIDRPFSIARLRNPDSRFVPVSGLIDGPTAAKVRAARLPGVGLETRRQRTYHHEGVGAALIGFVGFDDTGLSGVELRFDSRMTGHDGQITYQRDSRRRALWVQPGDYEPAQVGAPVQLSIDIEIQRILERRLTRAVEEHNANGARAVVVDVRTGEILAMHDIVRPRPGMNDQLPADLADADPSLRPNRCATDPYEPGSTFKPVIWATATEHGHIADTDELPCPQSTGWRTPYGRLIRDTHYYGTATWRKVLIKSINTGMAMVAERMTHSEMREAVLRFGFGEKTRAGVPGETRGVLTPAKKWSKYTQSSVAMGHEIAVSVLQMARAYCVFGRDGTMPELRLIAVDDPLETMRFERQVVSPSIAKLTREVMHEVTTQGTGRKAVSAKYRMFAKSGTAQLYDAENGGYHEDRYTSSYVAGAPLETPRIVVVCVIDDPDKTVGEYYGGRTAGPVVRDVVDETLTYLGVAPDQPGAGDDGPNPDSMASAEPNAINR